MIRSFSGRQAAVGSEGVMLYGLVTGEPGAIVRMLGVDAVSLRDLVAIVRRVPWGRVDATTAAIREYRQVVEGVFRDRPIVPAPFGSVFRSRDALVRWMELHHVTLHDGVEFVQGRDAARVRMVARANAVGPDFESAVFNAMRALTPHAVASLSVTQPTDLGTQVADASFLIEREKWSSFRDAVRHEQERSPMMAMEESGPWPAYDFVRLQFGG